MNPETVPINKKTKQMYPVAKTDEIAPGQHKIVEVGGRSIGVYNINGEYYAIRNVCPHQGAELCKGLVMPYVTSDEAGCLTYEREGEIVRCPWHQWEFDIKTGYLVVDPKTRTRSYDVTVEKFDISVEADMVVVHM